MVAPQVVENEMGGWVDMFDVREQILSTVPLNKFASAHAFRDAFASSTCTVRVSKQFTRITESLCLLYNVPRKLHSFGCCRVVCS